MSLFYLPCQHEGCAEKAIVYAHNQREALTYAFCNQHVDDLETLPDYTIKYPYPIGEV